MKTPPVYFLTRVGAKWVYLRIGHEETHVVAKVEVKEETVVTVEQEEGKGYRAALGRRCGPTACTWCPNAGSRTTRRGAIEMPTNEGIHGRGSPNATKAASSSRASGRRPQR